MRFFRFRKQRQSKLRREAEAAALALEETTIHPTADGPPRMRLPKQAQPTSPKRLYYGASSTDPSSSSQDKADFDSDENSLNSFEQEDFSYSTGSDGDVMPQHNLVHYQMQDLVLGEMLGQGTFATVPNSV